MTRRTTHTQFARELGRTARSLKNMIRRMLIVSTDAVLWTLHGHRDERSVESFQAEVYAGVGFAARPPKSGNPEAIVVTVEASANHPVIVATRDRTTEGAVVEQAGLEPGETLVFNGGCILKLTKDGDVLLGNLDEKFHAVARADHTHRAPAITGQAAYAEGATARTGPPDKVSEHVKVN